MTKKGHQKFWPWKWIGPRKNFPSPPNSAPGLRHWSNLTFTFLRRISLDMRKLGSRIIVCIRAAASIWFEIWGSWIRVKKCWFFTGKFPKSFDFPGKNFDFSWEIDERFRFFQEKCFIFAVKLTKNFNFSSEGFWVSRENLDFSKE